VVEDIKLQRSPLQNSNFVITLSVEFVLTRTMVKLEFGNGDLWGRAVPELLGGGEQAGFNANISRVSMHFWPTQPIF